MCVRKHVTLSTSCLMGNDCSNEFNDFRSLGLWSVGFFVLAVTLNVFLL